jgi:hypothetical protein
LLLTRTRSALTGWVDLLAQLWADARADFLHPYYRFPVGDDIYGFALLSVERGFGALVNVFADRSQEMIADEGLHSAENRCVRHERSGLHVTERYRNAISHRTNFLRSTGYNLPTIRHSSPRFAHLSSPMLNGQSLFYRCSWLNESVLYDPLPGSDVVQAIQSFINSQ